MAKITGKPKPKFVITTMGLIPVVEIEKDSGWFVRADEIFRCEEQKIFDNRDDAMYKKLLNSLEDGKTINNYKGSKYYQFYLERLAKENPEYLL